MSIGERLAREMVWFRLLHRAPGLMINKRDYFLFQYHSEEFEFKIHMQKAWDPFLCFTNSLNIIGHCRRTESIFGIFTQTTQSPKKHTIVKNGSSFYILLYFFFFLMEISSDIWYHKKLHNSRIPINPSLQPIASTSREWFGDSFPFW